MTCITPNGRPQSHRRYQRRLYDVEAKVYLHQQGTGTTPKLGWAWMGTPAQANTLEAQAKIRGEDWPFTLIKVEGEGFA